MKYSQRHYMKYAAVTVYEVGMLHFDQLKTFTLIITLICNAKKIKKIIYR